VTRLAACIAFALTLLGMAVVLSSAGERCESDWCPPVKPWRSE
jgi:hypothetical protein